MATKALYLAGRTTSNAFLQMTDRLKEWAQGGTPRTPSQLDNDTQQTSS